MAISCLVCRACRLRKTPGALGPRIAIHHLSTRLVARSAQQRDASEYLNFRQPRISTSVRKEFRLAFSQLRLYPSLGSRTVRYHQSLGSLPAPSLPRKQRKSTVTRLYEDIPRLNLGSSTSRKASPKRLNPSTESTMAIPGKIAVQGATSM